MKLPPPGFRQPIPDYTDRDERFPLRFWDEELKSRAMVFCFARPVLEATLRVLRAAKEVMRVTDEIAASEEYYQPAEEDEALRAALAAFDFEP